MFIDTEQECAVGEKCLHHLEPTFSEITEPSVVMATLGVVVMRNDCNRQTDWRQQIKTFEPVRIGS